jgi:hypothetical protein
MSANPPGGRGLDSRAAAASDRDLLQVMGTQDCSAEQSLQWSRSFIILPNKSNPFSRISLQTLRRDVLYYFPAEELSSIHCSGRGAPGEANVVNLKSGLITRRLWYLSHDFSGRDEPGLRPYLNIGRESVLSISKIVMRVEVLLYILFIFP